MKRKRALYALGMLMFAGAGLGVFILAADEQSVISSGLPDADRIRLQDLVTQGSGKNQHVELTGFYFGKQYVYTAKLVQFRDVYLPVFATGKPEEPGNLQVLIWIRNDRNSNERFIQSETDLNDFVAEFNRRPRSVSGVLRKSRNRVRDLAAEAYPGVKSESLQILWARDFPSQQSTNVLWTLLTVCLAAAAACAVAYRRQSRPSKT
jgi:hypothetical protein